MLIKKCNNVSANSRHHFIDSLLQTPCLHLAKAMIVMHKCHSWHMQSWSFFWQCSMNKRKNLAFPTPNTDYQ